MNPIGDTTTNAFAEMVFSIEKTGHCYCCNSCPQGEYTMELAQDLPTIHGLDAETELANILSAEILAEINRGCKKYLCICCKRCSN